MGKGKGIFKRLLVFNAILAAVNIVLFSNAFLKVALVSALGIAVIVASVLLFFYVNWLILNPTAKKIDPKQTVTKLVNLEACSEAISGMGDAGTFGPKMSQIQEQIGKMQKKRDLIKDILLQKFSDTEMSYQKFKSIVDGAENVMCLNIRSIINRMYAFDEDEYQELTHGRSSLSPTIAQQKLAIYKEYIDFVDKAVDDNEEILLKLDKLLLEISKFNSLDAGELEGMEAVKELDSLITDTKWFK